MNVIREISRINEKELNLVSRSGISQNIHSSSTSSASWHADYDHSSYIYFGGLSYDLNEGDIITIFSQYGNVVDINLIRDNITGKSKGYGFLSYEDQRSTILAVDNFSGTKILGRVLKVDHCKAYRQPKDKETEVLPELATNQSPKRADLDHSLKQDKDVISKSSEEINKTMERSKHHSKQEEEREAKSNYHGLTRDQRQYEKSERPRKSEKDYIEGKNDRHVHHSYVTTHSDHKRSRRRSISHPRSSSGSPIYRHRHHHSHGQRKTSRSRSPELTRRRHK